MWCSAVVVLLIVSIVLQLAAAVMAIVLIHRSGFTVAWGLIVVAIVLMTIRRITSLVHLIGAGTTAQAPVGPEIIALVISLALFTGLLLLLPALRDLVGSRDKYRDRAQANELLVRESHHHVKNDLQLLSSLVSLQRDESNDDTLRGFLSDLMLRIRALSLSHERLYRPADAESFQYYVQGIIDSVRDAFSNGSTRVAVVNEVGDLDLSRDQLLHCGLVLNEALTNTMKHAFTGIADPRVVVRTRFEHGSKVLEIADNGVGLPPSVETDGFGTRLMETIVEAEGWALELESNGGTTVRLVM